MQITTWVLALCLLLLFATRSASVVAARRGDRWQVRALQYLRLGLGLSACSYLLRLMATPGSAFSFVSLFCCLTGTVLIWVGFLEHLRLARERLAQIRAGQDDTDSAEPAFPAVAGLPCLTHGAYRVLRHAEAEARGQRRCIDTDHLLLGLLRETDSAGAQILDRLGVKQENVQRTLGQPLLSSAGPKRAPAAEPPLTDRARRVFALAAQEAHRFDRETVGTEHLLLGLVLAGTGDAASALFQAGATPDGIREVIQKGGLPR